MKPTIHRSALSPRAKRRKVVRRTGPRPPLVLLVDDNADLRDLIKTVLTAVARLRVVEAGTSRAALNLAHRRKVALVISDIARPGMNGLKFLRLFKKAHPDIPVIVASGDPSGTTEVQARELGAFAFLGKPFFLETLLEVVDRALKHNGK